MGEGRGWGNQPAPASAGKRPRLSAGPALTLLCPHRFVHSPFGGRHTQGEGIDGAPIGAGPQRGAVAGACREAKDDI